MMIIGTLFLGNLSRSFWSILSSWGSRSCPSSLFWSHTLKGQAASLRSSFCWVLGRGIEHRFQTHFLFSFPFPISSWLLQKSCNCGRSVYRCLGLGLWPIFWTRFYPISHVFWSSISNHPLSSSAFPQSHEGCNYPVQVLCLLKIQCLRGNISFSRGSSICGCAWEPQYALQGIFTVYKWIFLERVCVFVIVPFFQDRLTSLTTSLF